MTQFRCLKGWKPLEWETPRKGRWQPLVAAIIAVTLIVGGVAAAALTLRQTSPNVQPVALPEGLTQHDIAVTVSPGGDEARVAQSVAYRNTAQTALSEVWFYAHPNAYRSEETTPFFFDEMAVAYPEGFSPGGMEDIAVTVNGQAVSCQAEGPGGVHVRVPLAAPLAPEEAVTIAFTYTLRIPRSDGRYGYSQQEVRLCNAFMTPAVFDGIDWLLYAYGPMGDPFVHEVADYRVRIEADARFRLLATGYNADAEPTSAIRTFEAKAVREVAVVLSEKPAITQTEVGSTRVYALADTQWQADAALDTAKESLRIFSEAYGAYPYPVFSVVASDFFIGGMEYPGLVLIDESIYATDAPMLEYIIAHEVAHQWWYAVVGNDQCVNPWLDETLASHATLTYYLRRYGVGAGEQVLEEFVAPGALSAYGWLDQLPPVGAPIDVFADAYDYSDVVYDYGAVIFEQARETYGDDVLTNALAHYYRQNSFGLASPAAFFAAMEEGGSKALSDYLRKTIIYRVDPWP